MSEPTDQKSLILYAIWMTALAVVVMWAAYLVRHVLVLIYISGLLAIGFSPTIRLIERQKVLPIGTKRFPRGMAILILYLMIIGVLVGMGFLIVPPLVAQARQLWMELPGMLDRGVQFLASYGVLDSTSHGAMPSGRRLSAAALTPLAPSSAPSSESSVESSAS
jgi:predicted PurR-regulated permease PerM